MNIHIKCLYLYGLSFESRSHSNIWHAPKSPKGREGIDLKPTVIEGT